MVGLADTMVDHHSLARSPSWASRDGEGRSGSKGGEGCDGGSNRCPAAQMGPFFSRPPPRLVRRNDLKDASKARCSSSTNSSSVAISSSKNVTEYHDVALVRVKRGSVGAAELPPIPARYRFAAFTRFAEDGVASERLRARRSAAPIPHLRP